MSTNSYSKERGLVYANPDGKKLKMTLYLPDDAGDVTRPGMVLIHGGGWRIGNRYQQAWYCRQFARHGYVVMTIEYRLMPKYPFPHCLHDSKAAVRWLRLNADKYRVDPDRIVAFGASAGGHLAAFLGSTKPEHGFEGTENPGASSAVNAVVSLYGAVDLTVYRDLKKKGKASESGEGGYMGRFVGKPSADEADPYEVASPITYADADTAPIIFVHGMSDILVRFEQSRRFHTRLCELGVPTRLFGVPKRHHGFDYIHVRQRKKFFDEMIRFLDEHGASLRADAGETGASGGI